MADSLASTNMHHEQSLSNPSDSQQNSDTNKKKKNRGRLKMDKMKTTTLGDAEQSNFPSHKKSPLFPLFSRKSYNVTAQIPADSKPSNETKTSDSVAAVFMQKLTSTKSKKKGVAYSLALSGTQMAALPVLSSVIYPNHADDKIVDCSQGQPTDEEANFLLGDTSQNALKYYLEDQFNAPIASSESLLTQSVKDLSLATSQKKTANHSVVIPAICEELIHEEVVQPTDNSACQQSNQTNLLLLKSPCSRASSTGDSAVDLKFNEEDHLGHLSGESVEQTFPPLEASTSSSSANCSQPVITPKSSISSYSNGCDGLQISNNSSTASWKKLKNFITWIPFIQQNQRRKYPWIQLAGHQGNFRSGEQGTILKKYCHQESLCLEELMNDILKPFVPEYFGVVDKDDEKYVRMEDLLMKFTSPTLMDCKLGVRTYLEEELKKARESPKARPDMYNKMVEIDPEEPTAEEQVAKAITKPRYMQWRETISSTSELAFRIEGIKVGHSEKSDQSFSQDYKKVKTRTDIKRSFGYFTDSNPTIIMQYIRRLLHLRTACESSPFFFSHECIGSSLLFLHDESGTANVWIIDFGKTIPLPSEVTVNHRSEWIEGNHEDGYLTGVDNLIQLFYELYTEIGGHRRMSEFHND